MAKMKPQGNITPRRSIAAVTGLAVAWLVTPVPAIAQNAYITNQGTYPNFSNNVTVIDTITNKVVTTIEVGLAPSGVAVAPDGTKVYVANETVNGTVSVIDTATNAVSATIAVGNNPIGVAVKPDGRCCKQRSSQHRIGHRHGDRLCVHDDRRRPRAHRRRGQAGRQQSLCNERRD